jgi:hypothetical protein
VTAPSAPLLYPTPLYLTPFQGRVSACSCASHVCCAARIQPEKVGFRLFSLASTHDSHAHTDSCAYMPGRKASSGPAENESARPHERKALGQFTQSKRPQNQKASVEPRPEDAPQTTVLRGREWEEVVSAGRIALDAGTVVRVMSQHAINECDSEWLDKVVHLDRRSFVFCALHAHMLLTEALVKDMFGHAIESRRVTKESQSSRRHSRHIWALRISLCAPRRPRAGTRCRSTATSAGALRGL